MKKIIICLLIITTAFLCGCGFTKGQNKPYKPQYDKSYEDYEVQDPYELKYDTSIIEAYENKINDIEKKRRADLVAQYENDSSMDYSKVKNLKYDLIFLNDDNIPELVINDENNYIGIYTFKNDKVEFIGDQANEPKTLVYGDGENQPYEYIIKTGIIYNITRKMSGLAYYYNYQILDKDLKFKNVYNGDLCEFLFDDLNGNKKPDDEEAFGQNHIHYYFGDKEITEEKYLDYDVPGKYENLRGTKIADEMKEALEDLVK